MDASLDSSVFRALGWAYLYLRMITFAVELLILSFLAALLMVSPFSMTSRIKSFFS